jgi:hypothetical protein
LAALSCGSFLVSAVIERRLVVQRRQRDVGLDRAVVPDNDAAAVGQVADHREVQFPFLEDGARGVLAVGPQHHQHALLAFRQHELVGGHAGFACRHLVEIQFDADTAFTGHLYGGTGQAGGAHVLDGDNGVGGHEFQAGLDQELFGEGVTDLDGGAFFLGVGGELGGGHGGAVDAVAAGLRADIHHGVADTRRDTEENAVFRRDPHGHRVDQRIAVVGGMEIDLATNGRNADAIAIAADAAHYAIDDALGHRIAG